MFKRRTIISFLLLLAINCFAEEKSKNATDFIEFEKRNALLTYNETFFYGGFLYPHSLDDTFVTGFEYLFHPLTFLAFGPTFGYSRAKYSNSVLFNQPGFFTDNNIYLLDMTLMLPMTAAFKAGKSIVEADLFAVLGVGAISINSTWEPHGFFGGGMKIYLLKWFAVRVDMRSNFHAIKKPGGGDKFERNLSLLFGTSFRLPPLHNSK